MLKSIVNGAEHDITRIPMKGKNLFNKNAQYSSESYYLESDGTETAIGGFNVTDYYEVEPNTQYYLQDVNISSTNPSVCFYDSAKQFISGVKYNRSPSVSITTPQNTAYIKFSVNRSNTDLVMLINGSTALPYEPYGYQNGWEVRDNQDRLIWGREDELQTTTGTLPFKGYGLDIKEYSIDGNMVQATEQEYSITGTSPLDFQSNGSNATISISGNTTQASNQAYTTSGTSPLSFNADGTNLTALSMNGNMNQASSQPYTVSGTSPISFMNNGTDIDYTVSGSMLQSGTPTPTSPITPQECGERTEQMIVFPYYDSTGNYSGVTFTVYPDGRVTASGTTAGGANFFFSRPIELQPGTYTISLTGLHTGMTLLVYDPDAQRVVASISGSSSSYTFTITETITSLRIYFNTGQASAINIDCYPMLNTGSIALPYEPYGYKIPVTNGSTTYNIYLSEPLRKIGDYSDTVNSDGSVTRVIKKIVFTGQETYTKNGSYTQFYMTFSNQSDYTISGDGDLVMSSHFKGVVRGNIGYNGGITTRSTRNGLMMSHSSSADATAFASWVASQYEAGTPVTAWYVLATEQTDTATVPTITPTSGNNTLSVDTTLAPSNITVTSNYSVFPDNPITPIECGVKTENLFDNDSALIYAATISKNDIGDDLVFPFSTGGNRRCVFIQVDPNTTYTWSCVSSDRLVIAEYNETYTKQQLDTYTVSNRLLADREIHFNIINGESNYTFTTSDTAKMIGIYYQLNSAAENIMLNTGSTAAPYEPYGYKIPITVGSTTSNIFINQPIRKIGNYSDSIGSDGVVTRNIKKIVFDGTEDWHKRETPENSYYISLSAIAGNGFCTHFQYARAVSVLYDGYIYYGTTAISLRLDSATTTADFQAYLASQYQNGTPVEVWYVLSTPDTTETTTIPTISTVNGSNTLTTGTPITPSNITISTSSSVYPKNPIYPEECGDRTANLFDGIYTSAVIGGSSGDIYSTNSAGKTAIIPCNPNTEYTVKKHDSSNRFTIAESNTIPQNQDTVSIIYSNDSANEYTFTTSATSKYLLIYVSTSTQQAEPRLMVNIGSTALSYEPYGYKIPVTIGSNTNYIYTKEPIRKIGNYADVVNSDGTVTRCIKKLIFTGNEYISTYRSNSSFLIPAANKPNESSTIVFRGFCSHYKQTTRDKIYNSSDDYCISPSSGDDQIVIRDTNCADTTAFKTFLATQYENGTPVTVWYILSTPTTEQTTIPTLTTVDGKNTATIGTTLTPSSITINATSKVYPNNPIIPEICGVRTENLLDYTTVDDTANVRATATLIPGGISVSGQYYVQFTSVDFVIGRSYTMSWIAKTISGTVTAMWRFHYTDNTYSSMLFSGGSLVVEKEVYSLLLYVNASSTESGVCEFTNIMLNTGSSTLQYEPYGYKIPFNNNGENLFDESTATNEFINSDGSITPGSATDIYYLSDYISADNITISVQYKETAISEIFSVGIYDSSKSFIRRDVISNNSVSYENVSYIRINYRNINCQNVMLNSGNTALPYSPYLNKTTPIYLGEVPTIRRIKKLVLTGAESLDGYADGRAGFRIVVSDASSVSQTAVTEAICSHFTADTYSNVYNDISVTAFAQRAGSTPATAGFIFRSQTYYAKEDFIQFLIDQYEAGTPVTIWYILADQETGIVNEPLAKIGDYADEITTIKVHGLSSPLYGIGEYKDILNLSTGVLTRKIKKLVLNGTENWQLQSINSYGIANFYISVSDRDSSSSQMYYCSHFIVKESGISDEAEECMRFNTNNQLFLRILSTTASTVTGIQQWIAAQYANGTPVTIWYVLSTSTTETVTVPTGMTGEIEGYLTQISIPTPTNQSIPKWNGEEETGGTYAVTVYDLPEIQTTTGQNTLTVETEKIHGITNPLCGIGNYKDVMNLSTGIITRKIKKLVLDGTESGYTVITSSNHIYAIRGILNSEPELLAVGGVCTHFRYNNAVSSLASNMSDGDFVLNTIVNDYSVCFKIDSINSASDMADYFHQQYQAGHPVTVWYVLETSETETITVPYGLECSVEGYLTQSGTPTPSNPITPDSNGILESDGTYAVEVSLEPSNLTVKGHIKAVQ